MSMPQPVDPSADALGTALERSVDALVECAIPAVVDGRHAVTWGTWVLSAEGEAVSVTGGRSDLYSGDSGIAYALRRLGAGLDRPELASLADVSVASVVRRSDLTSDGWLSGTAGPAAFTDLGWTPSAASSVAATDLTSGVAGILLALVRRGATAAEASAFVAELRRRATPTAWGSAWTDPTETGDAARPLCGLAHGASGIVWSLVEAANAWPQLAEDALALADEGLRWEATWADPTRGGWPDLRAEAVTWPALWCHGAAGGGAVRLRLLELLDGGLASPWPRETLLAEAEAAIQACGAAVSAALDGLAAGVVPHAGLTICHGLGGPLLLLAEASRVLGVPAHADFAREATVAVLSAFADDPASWPSGFRGADGDLGLLSGLAGTALLLAALTRPERFPRMALLG
jgi:lantibiotic modifying enzyme